MTLRAVGSEMTLRVGAARRTVAASVIVVMFVAAQAEAQQRSPTLFDARAGKDPYARLFTPSTIAQPRPAASELQTEERADTPKVICGTLVVPADANVDPHMRKSPAANDQVTYRIRVMKPPMCTGEDLKD